MRRLNNIKWMPLLMTLTIVAIAAFQFYWLSKAYEREEKTLEMRTNFMFRDVVRSLQATKLKLDRLTDSSRPTRIFVENDSLDRPMKIKLAPTDPKMIAMIDVMTRKINDSGRGTVIITQKQGSDSVRLFNRDFSKRRDRLMQFLFDVDSLQDSIKVKELEVAYAKKLEEQNLDVPFSISSRVEKPKESNQRGHDRGEQGRDKERRDPVFNEVTLGFSNPVVYRMDLGSTRSFLMWRISTPILFSFFLLGFTILSFSLLYRNLQKQKKLSEIKNEFISNITHELKTPIATVSVAIEALRSFNASMDPARTKEYLDISANELLRLSLLVDKVLKLSMFEKKAIELKYEELDMRELVNEVTSSMRLQFEKHHADVKVTTQGDTHLEGDRLHLVSVIFNLMDNALKYSTDKPSIGIYINGTPSQMNLTISDTGIGIPSEYHGKVFEKFFRVPTGNLHNAKGYGLGLSYVAHVINRHHGTIRVESMEGNGSKFIINIPRKENGI